MLILNNFLNGTFDDFINKFKLVYSSVIGKIDIQEELEKNEILLGITDIYGEGIILTINDGSDITHQEDIVVLFDEIKNAGAEAISINEKRITNSTYIYCDGNVILVDGQKLQAPFTIKAIGNKNDLKIALLRNKGYVEVLQRAGLEVNIEEKEQIQIPRYRGKIFEKYEKEKSDINKIVMSNKLIGKTSINDSGIEITINDKITAVYLMQIINNLKSGGASAISVNNQRIVNMTDIVQIGETMHVNSNSIDVPYTIRATGNTNKLIEEMNLANSTINKLKQKGINSQIISKKYVNVIEYIPKRENSKMELEYVKNNSSNYLQFLKDYSKISMLESF